MALESFEIAGVLKMKDEMTAVVQKATTEASKAIGVDLTRAFKDAELGNKGMNDALRQFAGIDVVAQAHAYDNAVTAMGGATKLTTAEQKQVNAAVTEAIAKYEALGQAAPASLKALEAETRKLLPAAKDANAGLEQIWSGLKGAAGLIGVTFGASAIAGFVGNVLDAASAINDTASKLGISAEAAQGFKFAAEQAGATLDNVSSALTTMNKHLAEGDKSAVDGLKALGLNFNTIRNMKPEDAFLAITDAIQQIPDPIEQTDVALKLLGKSGVQLLPAIKDGFRGVSDAAQKMSNDTIKALDDAGDAWGKLKDQVVIFTGGMIAKTLDAGKELASGWRGIGLFLDNAIKLGPAAAITMAGANNQVAESMHTLTEKQKETIASYIKVGVSVDDLKKQLHLTDEQFAIYMTSAVNAGKATEDLGKKTHLTQEEQKALDDVNRKAADAVRQHAEAVQKLADTYSGADSIRKAKDTVDAVNVALKQGVTVAQMSVEAQKQINKAVDEGIDAFARHGQVAPQAMRDLWFATIQVPPVIDGLTKMVGTDMTDAFKKSSEHLIFFSELLGEQIPLIDHSKAALKAYLSDFKDDLDQANKKIADAKKAHEEYIKSIDAVASALAQLAQIAGGTFGNVAKGAATLVSSFNTVNKSIDTFKAGLTELHTAGGSTLQGIAQMSTGILGMVSAAISAGKAISGLVSNLFGLGTAGRDAVKDFAASFGGFDALHDKLNTLGDAGGQLWIKLTQGVDRNNPAEAKKAIDAINKAFDEQKQKIEALNTDIGGLFKQLVDAGGKIPESMQPVLDALVKSGKLTGENAALIAQLSGDSQTQFKQMEDAANRYGISLADLGPKFQANKLHESAQQIWDDFNLLVDNGANVDAVMKGMSGKISDLVNNSIAFGIAIPSNFKPLIEKLAASGLLLDGNKQQIKDLTGINFEGDPLMTSIQTLIDKIGILIDSFVKDLIPAMDKAGKTIVSPTIKPRYDPSDLPGGGGEPADGGRAGLAFGGGPEGSALNFGGGGFTPVSASVVSGGSGSQVFNIAINGANKDGRQLARELMHELSLTRRFEPV